MPHRTLSGEGSHLWANYKTPDHGCELYMYAPVYNYYVQIFSISITLVVYIKTDSVNEGKTVIWSLIRTGL